MPNPVRYGYSARVPRVSQPLIRLGRVMYTEALARAGALPIWAGMIIKLIDRKEGGKGALRYAHNLARYMTDADPRRLRADALGLDYGLTLSAYMIRRAKQKKEPRERVLDRGALVGGKAADWVDGVAEMERRLQARSSRVKKPARHVVLSYRPGERPTGQQCHDAVVILAEELGCEAAAILWAAHDDTDTVHIHALVVTVDPVTGAALPFGQGPDGRASYKEAMQRAIARIEFDQALQAEAGGRYEVRNGHVVRRAETALPTPVRKRTPLAREVLAFEENSGFWSFTRFAQELAGPILDAATSWADLHRDLARYGIGVRAKDNGGELYAGADHVKLSKIDRRHSWTQLIKPDRLGPYVQASDIEFAPYEPRVLDERMATAWLERREAERALGAKIDGRVAALIAARDAALDDLRASITAHRDDLASFAADSRLRRDIAAAWPTIGTDATEALRAAFDARIAAVRALRHAAAGADDLNEIDLDGIGAIDGGIAGPWYADNGSPPTAWIQGFEPERCGNVVRYWRADDTRRSGQPAILDAGAILWVNDTSDDTIAAALRLATERYGQVAAFGDPAYLARCAAVAGKLGIEISKTTAAEAKRRAASSLNGRDEARGRSLVDAKARKTEWLRRWARAYVQATPGEVEAELERVTIASLSRVPTGHAATPTLQSVVPGPKMPDAEGVSQTRNHAHIHQAAMADRLTPAA